MGLEFEKKVVLVTGGTKGIGLACARAFLAEGARVAVVSRSASNVERACAELGNVIGLTADLVDDAAALRAVEEVERELGPIDILVNSAGAAKRTPHNELTPGAYRGAMDAKYFTYINVIDPVVKRMASRRSGVIVNVIGNGGKIASPIHLAGGAANAALMLLTAGLAHAYGDQGLRIVAVNPGLTETERVVEGFKADARHASISEKEALERSLSRIPLGRFAKPDEIASCVLFLASRRAAYVTGVSLTMDGAATPVIF